MVERPRAVSEYVVERLTLGGADKLCFVISPTKTDIIRYYGARFEQSSVAFVVQPEPAGLCDAFFRAAPFVGADEPVALGLPDTIWFPEDGLKALPHDRLAFLLFPAANPQVFDVVVHDAAGRVETIQVKPEAPRSNWIWGAFRAPGAVYHQLHDLWLRRGRQDVYVGDLVNAWIVEGGEAVGVRAGESYVDVGTYDGYREAIRLLSSRAEAGR